MAASKFKDKPLFAKAAPTGPGFRPSMGGMAASLVTMFIVPCLFCAVEEWKWKRRAEGQDLARATVPGSAARP